MKEVQEDRATASAGTGRHLGCAGFCKNRLTPLLPLIVPAEPPPCLPALPLPPTGAASPEPPGYPFPGEDRAPPSTTATSTAGTEPGPGAAAAPALPSSGCCPLPAAIIPPSAAPAAHPSLRQQATGFGFASQSGGSKPSPPPPLCLSFPRGSLKQMQSPPPPPPRAVIASHRTALLPLEQSPAHPRQPKNPPMHCRVQAIFLKASSAEARVAQKAGGCSAAQGQHRAGDRSRPQPRQDLERGDRLSFHD